MSAINPIYFLAFFISFLVSLGLTLLVIRIASNLKIVDQPNLTDRKIHNRAIPLLGGWAIFLSVFISLLFFRLNSLADFSQITDKFILAVFLGGLLIMLGGTLDDKYRLKPWQQIIWPLLASALVLLSGIKITYLTNPLGGPANAIIYLTPLIGGLISFGWLMGLMYTTKLLDGLDGLVTGITAVAALMIFLISLDWDVYLSATGVWSLSLLGASLGFLIFNWQPAKIFLGEGGSIFMGYSLGILSIVSGSKIATTFLVIGIPALDVILVMINRLIKKESPFSHADKRHLHFRLLAAGFGHRQAVLFLYLIAITFGLLAVWGNSLGKLISLMALLILTLIIVLIIYKKSAKNASA